jgi:hypothetical protein
MYDLGLPSLAWCPIPDQLDTVPLPGDQQLGQFPTAQSPFTGIPAFQESGDLGGAYHGFTVGGGFAEIPRDHEMDSTATTAAPSCADFYPSSSYQSTADSEDKKSAEEILECITLLCELNGALCEYHAPATATKLRVGDVNQPNPPNLAPLDCLNDETDEVNNLELSNLHIGHLLSLTSQLGAISVRLGTPSSVKRALSRGGIPMVMAGVDTCGDACGPALEQAAYHLIVGCYYRLEHIFSHVLRMLRKARDGVSLLRISALPQAGTPLLSIDGFALDGDRDMELDIAMHACEKVLGTTRRSIIPSEP